MICDSRFQQQRDVRCHQFLFPAKEGAEGNSRYFDRNMKENIPQSFPPSEMGSHVYTWWFYHLCSASPWMKQNSDHPGYCWSNSKANHWRHQISAKSISEQMGISCERDESFNYEGREPTNSPDAGDVAQYKFSVRFTFPVKWAGEGEGCASVWNWHYGKGWACGTADYWWSFLSLGLWSKFA